MMRKWCAAIVMLLVAATGGCERGCLAKRLALGDGGLDGGTADPLSVVDCAPGILRCRTGVVERHATATACATCTCPWVATTTTCANGCLVDDLEVLREESDAVTLCAPSGGSATFAPDAPIDAGSWTCSDEDARFQCHDGLVFGCGKGGGTPVARCSYGCVSEDEALDDPSVDVARARAFMCLRRATSGEP